MALGASVSVAGFTDPKTFSKVNRADASPTLPSSIVKTTLSRALTPNSLRTSAGDGNLAVLSNSGDDSFHPHLTASELS